MKTYAGWTADSRMPAMYVYLSGKDVEPVLFAAYGLDREKKDDIRERAPKRCPRCDTPCAHDEQVCHRCRMVLTIQSAMEAESEMESLKSKMQEIDQVVRRNTESSALQTRIMLAMAQGKIGFGKPIDFSLLSDDREAIQSFMKSYGVPAIGIAHNA
jgi:hypothetical protein